MFNPKYSYELVLKIIGWYLKATRDRVLVINPSLEINIDCYTDADIYGMYGHEKAT